MSKKEMDVKTATQEDSPVATAIDGYEPVAVCGVSTAEKIKKWAKRVVVGGLVVAGSAIGLRLGGVISEEVRDGAAGTGLTLAALAAAAKMATNEESSSAKTYKVTKKDLTY